MGDDWVFRAGGLVEEEVEGEVLGFGRMHLWKFGKLIQGAI